MGMSYNIPQPSPRRVNRPQDKPSYPKHSPSNSTFAFFNHHMTYIMHHNVHHEMVAHPIVPMAPKQLQRL